MYGNSDYGHYGPSNTNLIKELAVKNLIELLSSDAISHEVKEDIKYALEVYAKATAQKVIADENLKIQDQKSSVFD